MLKCYPTNNGGMNYWLKMCPYIYMWLTLTGESSGALQKPYMTVTSTLNIVGDEDLLS